MIDEHNLNYKLGEKEVKIIMSSTFYSERMHMCRLMAKTRCVWECIEQTDVGLVVMHSLSLGK